MLGPYLRKYGVETTVNFPLPEPSGVDLVTGATFASGDLKIAKDEGAEANTANLPTDEGTGYSLVLSESEMQAARIIVYVIDQTDPKVWMDQAIVIETYGHASAQIVTDLDGIGAEIHLVKAMIANKRTHTVSSGEDKVYDDDGSTLLRTMTPTDDGDDTVTITPS